QTYNTHLSASSTKTAPNDAIDDVIQNDTSPDPVNLDGSSNSSS
ncbi:MAG: hypothetical protein K0Q57_777, partial [Gammaproteobacteria bacterium]|nr:hypothetical protein [Gammaproteobacteria bacterium]